MAKELKIQITADCRHNEEHLAEGDVVSLPEDEARNLIRLNKAVEVQEKPSKSRPEQIRTGDPKAGNRDPKV